MKWKLEKTVQRAAADVDGGDTCRGQYDMFLLCRRANMTEKSRLACPCLACEKQTLAGVLQHLERFLKLHVAGVDDGFRAQNNSSLMGLMPYSSMINSNFSG